MNYSFSDHLISIVFTFACLIAAVLIHYEILSVLTKFLKKVGVHARLRILLLIFGLLAAHLIEVCVFALGYFFIDHLVDFQVLIGMVTNDFLDYVYFSVVTYAAVGYGEIVPIGPVRLLASMEALTGLVLVAWSASFTFLEMRVFWKDKDL